jgi:hypothetical protein
MEKEQIDKTIIEYIERARNSILRSQELTNFSFSEGDLLRVANMIQKEEHFLKQSFLMGQLN